MPDRRESENSVGTDEEDKKARWWETFAFLGLFMAFDRTSDSGSEGEESQDQNGDSDYGTDGVWDGTSNDDLFF